MASLQFQIHTDQENVCSYIPGSKGHQTTISGIRGKTFQSGTPFMNPTPRKALGDVNCNRDPPLSGKPPASLKPLSNKPVTKKPIQNILKQSGTQKENKGKTRQPLGNRQGKHVQKEEKKLNCPAPEVLQIPVGQQISYSDVEEIESMPIPLKVEDDFEDIWPKKERVSTYIEKLISWRPPCLFGITSVSDDEEDEEIKIREMMDLIDTLPKPAPIAPPEISDEDLKAPEWEEFPLSSIDDIPFPFIDETVLSLLEDSFSVVPHLEKLQLDM